MGLGRLLYGQILEGRRKVPVSYTEQVVPTEIARTLQGNPNYEIIPLDEAAAKVKIYGNPNLANYFVSLMTTGPVELPSILALSNSFVQGGGDSTYSESGAAAGTGSYSIALNLSGNAQASAYVMPEVTFTVWNKSMPRAPITRCWFYAPDEATALSILTAKLGATVSAWPTFREEPVTLQLLSQKVTASQRQSYQASIANHTSGTSLMQSSGAGNGFDFSPELRTLQIPPTLHGAITLGGTATQSQTATGTISLTGTGAGGGTSTATATAQGIVSPTSITATSPTDIPHTGLYLYQLDMEPNDVFQNNFVHAIVVNFALLWP